MLELSVDLQRLEDAAAGGIRLFLTSNPNNPTGTVHTGGTIQGMARLAVLYGFFVVVDELYCRLVYDGTPFTHLAGEPGMDTRSVTLLGGSKTESMTGYRIGAVVASDEARPDRALDRITAALASAECPA